ncbi:MAG: hypothetical protein HC848_02590 [Limnobacter sp.]|nr:hypothetical protein [Limnobacter sp.]
MNKRALVYLGAASLLLAGAFLYLRGKEDWQTEGRQVVESAIESGSPELPLAVVEAGTLVTEPLRLKTTAGMVVKLLVQSDSNDELHVHGIDLRFPVVADQMNTITFTPNQSGSFELELHDNPVLLGVLEVYPAQ